MIEIAGADRYMTSTHAGQMQGFFSIPGDVLTAFHILTEHIRKLLPSMDDPVVVAADLALPRRGATLPPPSMPLIAFVEKRRLVMMLAPPP
jgi:ribose-phosphate pyrophosphokinase